MTHDYDDDDYSEEECNRRLRTNSLVFFRRKMSKIQMKEEYNLKQFNKKMYVFIILLTIVVSVSIFFSLLKLMNK